MLSSLPLEIFDLIVDHLHDERLTLQSCCLVSKSWVSPAQRRLFARVNFHCGNAVGLWTKTFPDPSNSPARHTRTLGIDLSAVPRLASSGTRPWLRSFHLVVVLRLRGRWEGGGVSDIFNLICSFPLLEDIWLLFSVAREVNTDDGWTVPSTSSKFNGTFSLITGGIDPFIPRFLLLPRGLHFSRIEVSCRVGDTESVPDLVLRCSNTLEFLRVRYYPTSSGTPRQPSMLDLSNAINLKSVEIWSDMQGVQWITDTLQTVKPVNLRQIKITVNPPSAVINPVGDLLRRELVDLDHLLVKLWTSHSVPLLLRCRNVVGVIAGLFSGIASKKGVRVWGGLGGLLIVEATTKSLHGDWQRN